MYQLQAYTPQNYGKQISDAFTTGIQIQNQLAEQRRQNVLLQLQQQQASREQQLFPTQLAEAQQQLKNSQLGFQQQQQMLPLMLREKQAEIDSYNAQTARQSILSDIGGMMHDRDALVQKYGANDPRVAAMDRAINIQSMKGMQLGMGAVDQNGMPIMQQNLLTAGLGGAGTQSAPNQAQAPQNTLTTGLSSSQIPMSSAANVLQGALSGPQNAQAAMQPQQSPGIFMPSSVGMSSRGQASLYRNPFTGDTLSVLTPQGRSLAQNQLQNYQKLQEVIPQLVKYGSMGYGGEPKNPSANPLALADYLTNPQAAPNYMGALNTGKDYLLNARGLPKTDAGLETTEMILKRQPGESAPIYAARLNALMTNEINPMIQNLQSKLSAGGVKVPGSNQGSNAASNLTMPSFQSKSDFQNWYASQSPEVKQQIKARIGS